MSTNFSVNINNWKPQGNKNRTASAIALILILAISSSVAIMGISSAKAVTVSSVPTHAWLAIVPTTGVSQPVEVIMFLSEISFMVNGSGGGNTGIHFAGYSLTITAPDGTTQTMGPYTADPISNAYIQYTPTKTGTYQFQFSFPGQWINGTPPSSAVSWPGPIIGVLNLYYQPSTSNVATLTVTQQSTAAYPASPLPTGYWSNPINAENREWSSISGDWLLPSGPGSNNPTSNSRAAQRFQPYGASPTTGHVVWTKNIQEGGVVGGALGDQDFYTGESYEGMFYPIIINGMLYYPTPAPPRYGFYCVNLRTGLQEWYQNYSAPVTAAGVTNTGTPITATANAITLGQEYEYGTGNQWGPIAYLWYCGAIQYAMYDAFTGNVILYMNNSLAGSVYEYDSLGDLLAYNVGNSWLSLWNSSQAIGPALSTPTAGANALEWRPDNYRGQTLDWRKGIMWNVTTPTVPTQAVFHLDYADGVIVTWSTFLNTTVPLLELTGYNAYTGALIWQENETGLLGYLTSSTGLGSMADGVLTMSTLGDQTWYGFNVQTGALMWTIPPPANVSAWGVYDMCSDIANGIMYTSSYDGNIIAYNVTTGKLLWTWYGPSSGLETPYGDYPFGGLAGTVEMTVADGQLYCTTGEHSPNVPLYRGEFIVDLNATTGAEIWNETGWWQFPAFSDGYMVVLNGYDNTLYCFGQGQTATTVSAPQTVISQGTRVLLQGTVTDQSPGQTCLGTPAAGTPAVSDDSMSAWMQYLYQQQPKPTNVKGVPVTLTAFDPNNNTEVIGTTTSDASGNYAIDWTPPVPGIYTITATFCGSNSYFSSSSETHIDVVTATASAQPASTSTPTSTLPPTSTPTVPSQPTATPSPQVSTAPVPPGSSGVPTLTYVAVVAAVIIIAVVAAAIVLRRRK